MGIRGCGQLCANELRTGTGECLVWPRPADGSTRTTGFSCLNPTPGIFSTLWGVCQPGGDLVPLDAPALRLETPARMLGCTRGADIPSAWAESCTLPM